MNYTNNANERVRQLARLHNIPLWKIADAVNLSEGQLCRKLRHELPTEEQERLVNMIESIARGDDV